MPRELVEFGRVLDELLARRGWNQEQLSEATDPNVSQGQISNYRRGVRNPKRPTIDSLARALVPHGLDADAAERAYQRLHSRLLRAAGYAPETIYEADPAAGRLVEVWGGATEEGRRLMEKAADVVERAFSRDSIGRRADAGDQGDRADDGSEG